MPTREQARPWRARLAHLVLYEFSIAHGSLLYMVAFGVSAVLGVVRQVLLNNLFGLGLEASAYVAAFRLPETLAVLLAGGTLANALVPVLVQVEQRAGEAAARRFINVVLTALLLAVAALTVVFLLATPWFVRTVLAPGFDAPTAALTIDLTRLLLLELVILALISVVSTVLISRNQFLLPALAISVHNLTLLGGILASMAVPRLGIYGPVIGAVCDTLLQLVILLPGLWLRRMPLRPAWEPRNRDLHMVVRLLIPNGLSGAVNYARSIVETSFASRALTSGSVPALYNAWLLMSLPVRLLGVAIGQAAFPRLAIYATHEDWPALQRVLRQALAAALVLAVFTVVGLLLLGRPTIRLLFERGGAFTAQNGDLTYRLLVAYALVLPAAISTEILTRSIIALADTLTPLLCNLLQLGSFIGLIMLGLPRLDVLAIPLAFVCASLLEALCLWLVLGCKLHRRRLDKSPP